MLIFKFQSFLSYQIGISRASLIQMITSKNTPPSTSDATTDTTNGWLNETTTWQPTEGDSTISPGSTMDPAEEERLRKEEEAAEKELRVEVAVVYDLTLHLPSILPFEIKKIMFVFITCIIVHAVVSCVLPK